MVARFKSAPFVQFKAKDIFRASQLSLLGVSNSHVEKDRGKIRKGKSLSPLLLPGDEQNGKVVIADGYHRLWDGLRRRHQGRHQAVQVDGARGNFVRRMHK